MFVFLWLEMSWFFPAGRYFVEAQTLVFFFKLMSHHRQLTIFEFIAAALPVPAAAADVDLYHAPQKTVQQDTCARASPRRASLVKISQSSAQQRKKKSETSCE